MLGMKKRKMTLLLTGMIATLAMNLIAVAPAWGQDSLRVMFWNVENFFDYTDGGTGGSDAEFSSRGSRHWTKKRFYTKCYAIAKTIFWAGDTYGRLPDVVGFAEVENRNVIRALVNETTLHKVGYKIAHYDSQDHRGMDVAMIWRPDVFELAHSKPCHIYNKDGSVMPTRDILLVSLRDKQTGDTLHFAVNHHPSKYGGEEVSRPRRMAAMTRLKEICDSLSGQAIIAMGDFNDVPDNPVFGILGENMVNLSLPAYKKNEGTIRYDGKWELIDMFIVSADVAEKYRMEIIRAPFLLTRDNKHVGDKPLRTYSGPRYMGGVSDHCPIILLPLGR